MNAFFDTDVLVYVFDRAESGKQARAQELVAARMRARNMVLRGLALSQHHPLSAPDALIVQAALQAGCTTLDSEDFQAGLRFDDLVVVNPFRLQAHEPVAKAMRRRG